MEWSGNKFETNRSNVFCPGTLSLNHGSNFHRIFWFKSASGLKGSGTNLWNKTPLRAIKQENVPELLAA